MIKSPTLIDLPVALAGKVGWPWTEASPPLPDNGINWPRISIVTPSYNQGQYLEETIRSVLLQGYPNLEYLVIDGGSTDQSQEIICKYERWLTYWVSEKDRGQAHAINKGFSRCTGDLIGWINSDDLLLPGALQQLATAFRQHPQAILMGEVINFHDYFGFGQLMRPKNVTFETIVEPWRYDMFWHQPGVYVPRHLYQQVGELDESLRYTFDWDWLCRLLQLVPVHYLHVPVARFRYHHASKTVAEAREWLPETATVTRRYWPKIRGLDQELAEASLHAHMASVYVKLNSWDRRKALYHLMCAMQQDWQVLKSSKFWMTWGRAVTPVWLLKFARVLAVAFKRRWLR
jgi:glycosyltransferase involved in cell wall biosynthesis